VSEGEAHSNQVVRVIMDGKKREAARRRREFLESLSLKRFFEREHTGTFRMRQRIRLNKEGEPEIIPDEQATDGTTDQEAGK
jgi:hypothetical protein